MDVDLLAMMVGELILDNDKVLLPGIGSFVSENVPAAFSDRGYTINPPYRRLTFRPIMDEDDLLYSLYSKSNNVDIQTAKLLIQDFLVGLKKELQIKKMVVLPGLGRLRATKENNYFFVPDLDLNIDVDNWGLESVSLKTHQETKEEVSAALDNLKSIIESTESATGFVTEVVEKELQEESKEETEVESEVESDEVYKEEHKEETEEKPKEETEKGTEVEIEEKEVEIEEPKEETEVESKEVYKKETEEKKDIFWKILFLVVFVIIVITLFFVVLSRIAPELVQSWLYSPEEIKIIEYIL